MVIDIQGKCRMEIPIAMATMEIGNLVTTAMETIRAINRIVTKTTIADVVMTVEIEGMVSTDVIMMTID